MPARRFSRHSRTLRGNIAEPMIALRLVLQLERVPCLP
jgi:hypothetical protein